jgi:hypothetical protein
VSDTVIWIQCNEINGRFILNAVIDTVHAMWSELGVFFNGIEVGKIFFLPLFIPPSPTLYYFFLRNTNKARIVPNTGDL